MENPPKPQQPQPSRKRKKSKTISEEDLRKAQQERYDKLLYTAHKQVRKQAKQVKNILVQKGIKKNDASDELTVLKALDLEIVTQQALRQLGLYHCNPSLKVASTETENDDKEESDDNHQSKRPQSSAAKPPTKIPTPLSPNDPNYKVVNDILTHKKFLAVLEDWSSKVAEFRQWCSFLEEKRDRNKEYTAHNNQRKKLRRQQKQKNGGRPNNKSSNDNDFDPINHDLAQEPSAMFCTLNGDSGGMDEYNHDDDMTKKKKNRMGQRARKAKAMAIQAKLEGRTDYVSQNWRAPKAKQNEEENEEGGQHDGRPGGSFRANNERTRDSYRRPEMPGRSADSAPNNASEPVHASWAAKQAQKTGIVAFQGKKITFD